MRAGRLCESNMKRMRQRDVYDVWTMLVRPCDEYKQFKQGRSGPGSAVPINQQHDADFSTSLRSACFADFFQQCRELARDNPHTLFDGRSVPLHNPLQHSSHLIRMPPSQRSLNSRSFADPSRVDRRKQEFAQCFPRKTSHDRWRAGTLRRSA